MNWQKIVSKIIIIAIVFISGAFSGYSYCKRSNYKGVIKQQTKDAKEVLKHAEEKELVKKNVDEKIEVLKTINDPTGCLTVDSTDEYFNGLLDADREAKSGFD